MWSPDGKTVYYSSNAQGPMGIFARPADGTGAERTVLASTDEVAYPGSVSPDGKYLAYGVRSENDSRGMFDIWVLPLSGDSKPFPVVHNNFSSNRAAISPDAKWMAYTNNESGRGGIYITAFPGRGVKWQVSTNGGAQPQWRGKDRRELFFLDPTNKFLAVDVSTANGAVKLGIPHALIKPPGSTNFGGIR